MIRPVDFSFFFNRVDKLFRCRWLPQFELSELFAKLGYWSFEDQSGPPDAAWRPQDEASAGEGDAEAIEGAIDDILKEVDGLGAARHGS